MSEELLHAARNSAEKVSELLKNKTANELMSLLKYTNSDGNNAIMIACGYHPETVATLLAAIKTLPHEGQMDILRHVNRKGDNVFISATFNLFQNLKLLDPLFDAISDWQPKEQRELITRKTALDENLLMFIVSMYSKYGHVNTEIFERQKKLITRLFNIITPEEKSQMLTQVESGGRNALMWASQYQPALVKFLLPFIGECSIDEQHLIYHQAVVKINDNKLGLNALRIATDDGAKRLIAAAMTRCVEAQKRQSSIELILKAMSEGILTPNEQYELLKEKKAEEWYKECKEYLNSDSTIDFWMMIIACDTVRLAEQAAKNPQSTQLAADCYKLYNQYQALHHSGQWQRIQPISDSIKKTFKGQELLKHLENLHTAARIKNNEQRYAWYHAWIHAQETKAAPELLRSWANKPSLSIEEQVKAFNAPDYLGYNLLTSTFTALQNKPAELKWAMHVLYAVMETFTEQEQRNILKNAEKNLTPPEMRELQDLLDELKKQAIETQLNALENELRPSAPPMKEPVNASAMVVKAQPLGGPVIYHPDQLECKHQMTYVQAPVAASVKGIDRAVLRDGSELYKALNNPKDYAATLDALRKAHLVTQINTYRDVATQTGQFNLLRDELKHNVTARRDLFIMQLASKAQELQEKGAQNSSEKLFYLHDKLTHLIDFEVKHANNSEKLNEVYDLWDAFINNAKSQANNTPLEKALFNTPSIDLLDALLQVRPQKIHIKSNQVVQAPRAAPKAEAVIPQKAMNAGVSSKALYDAIKKWLQIPSKDRNTQAFAALLQSPQAEALISYGEQGHNVLTLALETCPEALPHLVSAIKQLNDNKRLGMLNVCTKQNKSLLKPQQAIDKAFSGALLPNKQALYLLELERIIPDLPANQAQVLAELYSKLNGLENVIIDRNEAVEWTEAIKATRKHPAFAGKTGAMQWLKSALGYGSVPKGYGVGFFKPTIDTLFDELDKLPYQKPKGP